MVDKREDEFQVKVDALNSLMQERERIFLHT